MDRDQRLRVHAVVYRDWVAKYLGEPGFDPDDGFVTAEQEHDLLAMLQAAFAQCDADGQAGEG